jgi:hypothetical protein
MKDIFRQKNVPLITGDLVDQPVMEVRGSIDGGGRARGKMEGLGRL